MSGRRVWSIAIVVVLLVCFGAVCAAATGGAVVYLTSDQNPAVQPRPAFRPPRALARVSAVMLHLLFGDEAWRRGALPAAASR